MSGGADQSPRQRMIGMMYLVLTALLALQVSNSVLDKFVFIDETLQNSLSISSLSSKEVVEGIKAAVDKNGNKPVDMKVLTKAKTVQELADKLEERIYGIRDEIIKQNGAKDETGAYPAAKDYDKIMTYMLGPADSKNGEAYTLHKELDKYLDDIRALDDSLAIVLPGVVLNGNLGNGWSVLYFRSKSNSGCNSLNPRRLVRSAFLLPNPASFCIQDERVPTLVDSLKS